MNPMLMQMWMTAFGARLEAARDMGGEAAGYKAAKYADEVLRGAQKAAQEAKDDASKVVMT
jgi:hypothetical protein